MVETGEVTGSSSEAIERNTGPDVSACRSPQYGPRNDVRPSRIGTIGEQWSTLRLSPSEQLRLMAVHAHPDDESSKGAATMAQYVAEGVDVLVVTCTGGERGSMLNPALQDRPEIEANIAEIRRGEMDRAREILGVRQDWLGFVDSGLPEGDPLPPLPEGCFGLGRRRRGGRRAGRADPRVPSARDDDVRRERRLPAPRPHHVPQDLGGGVRRGRRPGRVSRSRRAVAAAEALLQHGLQQGAGAGAARGDARRGPGVAVRGVARSAGTTARTSGRRARTSPPGSCAPTTSSAATRRCSRTPPRSTRTAGSRVPLEIQREVWPTEDFELARSLVDTTMPEDDLFAGIRAGGGSPATRRRGRSVPLGGWPGRPAHLFAYHPVLGEGVLSLIYAAADWSAREDTVNESKKAGRWGLAIVLLFGIACYFLFRSMSRHLRKVREEFPEGPDAAVTAEPTGEPGESTPPRGRVGPHPPHRRLGGQSVAVASLSRAEVLAYRYAAQGLRRDTGHLADGHPRYRRPGDEAAGSPARRRCPNDVDATGRPAGPQHDLALVWSYRGAPHLPRRRIWPPSPP